MSHKCVGFLLLLLSVSLTFILFNNLGHDLKSTKIPSKLLYCISGGYEGGLHEIWGITTETNTSAYVKTNDVFTIVTVDIMSNATIMLKKNGMYLRFNPKMIRQAKQDAITHLLVFTYDNHESQYYGFTEIGEKGESNNLIKWSNGLEVVKTYVREKNK